MSKSQEPFSLDVLHNAVAGRAAAFRCRATLSPAGGPGDKVFPPTYAGAVYATEQRRLPGSDEPVECVLLDSVQSQANRMEEALQEALDSGRLTLPVIEVDFEPYFPGEDKDQNMRLLDPVGRVTSLQAPHRIADAILRDSMLDDQPFRKSEVGQRIGLVSSRDATVLFELCPTALLFGMWDSTGPKGGLGAKFERAMVSEIVGIKAVFGVKTSSRIDPLGIQRVAGPLYRRDDGGYTLDPDLAVDEMKEGKPTGKKLLYKPNTKGQDVFHDPTKSTFADQGRPSEANHGNVTPDFARYSSKSITADNRETIDIMRDDGEYIRAKRVSPGGVTIDRAEQTIVLSLPALRRLRFPLEGQRWKPSDEQRRLDDAARTVLAALGLCAAALADEAGLDLRSRCLLYPEKDLTWELLDRKSGVEVTLSAEDAIALFNDAVAAARDAGLPWREEPLVLRPSDELVNLVVKSQQLAVQQGGDSDEGGA